MISPKNLHCKTALYADDTVLYTSSKNKEKIETNLQKDMDGLEQWCHQNKLTINTSKTKMMIFGSKRCRDKVGDPYVTFEGKPIEKVTQYTYLGVKLDQRLKYDLHARALIQKVSDKLTYLRRIRKFINATAALHIYKNMILPILEYGDILLISIDSNLKKKLQTLQNKALKCALGLDPYTETEEVHRLANLETLECRRTQHILQLMFKQKDNPFLWKWKKVRRSGAMTRSSKKKQFRLKVAKTERYQRSVTNKAPHMWNELPKEVQNIADLRHFKLEIKHTVQNKPKQTKANQIKKQQKDKVNQNDPKQKEHIKKTKQINKIKRNKTKQKESRTKTKAGKSTTTTTATSVTTTTTTTTTTTATATAKRNKNKNKNKNINKTQCNTTKHNKAQQNKTKQQNNTTKQNKTKKQKNKTSLIVTLQT